MQILKKIKISASASIIYWQDDFYYIKWYNFFWQILFKYFGYTADVFNILI